MTFDREKAIGELYNRWKIADELQNRAFPLAKTVAEQRFDEYVNRSSSINKTLDSFIKEQKKYSKEQEGTLADLILTGTACELIEVNLEEAEDEL